MTEWTRQLPRIVTATLIAFCLVQALFFALTLVLPRPDDIASNPVIGIALFRARAWETLGIPGLTLAILPGFVYAGWVSHDWARRGLLGMALLCTLACLGLMATEIERVFDGATTDHPAEIWARLTIDRWATFLLGLAAFVSIRLVQLLNRIG